MIKNKLSHFVKTLFIIQWTICLSIMLSACGGGNDLYFNSSVEADVSDLEETDGLVLQVGNSEKVTIKKSGATTLIGSIPVGNSYTVTLDKQPKDFQWCSLQNAAGVASENRNSIPVNCTSASGQVSTLTKIRTALPPIEGTLDNVTFNMPHTTVYDSLGNLYVADNDYVIRRITPSGAVTVYAGTVGVGGSAPNKLGVIGIGGLAVDKDDTIYFTEYPNKVRRIRKSDKVIEDYFLVTTEVYKDLGEVSLMGLDFNSAGDLFVNDWFNAIVIKITADPTGKPKGQVYAGTVGVYNVESTVIDGGVGVGQFGANMGIDIDKDGNLYIADRGAGYRKVDKNGVISTPVFNTDISFDNMQTIVLDEYGNIYMMGILLTSYLVKITPSGKVSILAGSLGGIGSLDGIGSEAQFDSPMGFAMDPNGHFIVADKYNGVLRKVVPVSP